MFLCVRGRRALQHLSPRRQHLLRVVGNVENVQLRGRRLGEPEERDGHRHSPEISRNGSNYFSEDFSEAFSEAVN